MKPPLPRVHAVTDERVARRPDLDRAAADLAVGGGAALALHARGRALSGSEMFDLANRLAVYPSSRLFVNDRLDVALATPTAGVQLGRGGLTTQDARRLEPEWWIGVSVHNLDEARAAEAAGADYLLVGPVFPTASHPERAPLGTAGLAGIAALGLPVVAIGGITPARVAAVRGAGAYGVAAIRGLWDALEPDRAARQMVEGMTA